MAPNTDGFELELMDVANKPEAGNEVCAVTLKSDGAPDVDCVAKTPVLLPEGLLPNGIAVPVEDTPKIDGLEGGTAAPLRPVELGDVFAPNKDAEEVALVPSRMGASVESFGFKEDLGASVGTDWLTE